MRGCVAAPHCADLIMRCTEEAGDLGPGRSRGPLRGPPRGCNGLRTRMAWQRPGQRPGQRPAGLTVREGAVPKQRATETGIFQAPRASRQPRITAACNTAYGQPLTRRAARYGHKLLEGS